MKRIIRWEYWKNPLGGGPEYVDEADLEDGDTDDFDVDFEDMSQKMPPVRPVIPVPGGYMPLSVYGVQNFFNNFTFWVMHTNFRFTRGLKAFMNDFPGVEMFDIVSPYRARVAFAKCFDPTAVKWEIQEALNAHPSQKNEENPDNLRLTPELKEKIAIQEKLAREKFSYWVIYVIPNGEIAFMHTEQLQHYENSIELLRQAQELAGGIIYTSNDTKPNYQ